MNETTKMQKYKLRKIEASDISAVTKIIKKIGIREFKSCFASDEVKTIQKNNEGVSTTIDVGTVIGIDIAGIIIENYEKCQQEFFDFLGSLSEEPIDVAKMPINEFAELIIEITEKEEFAGFLSVVSKLFK